MCRAAARRCPPRGRCTARRRRRQRRLRTDLEHLAEASDHALHVVAGRVVGVVHDRLGARVVGGQAHVAAAVGRQQTRRRQEPVGVRVAHALVDDLHGDEVELDIGRGRVGTDAHEAAGLREVRGEGAGLRGFVLLQGLGLERQQQADFLRGRPHRIGGGVVWRFSPTAGWSSSTSISRIVRCSAGPTPESISSCGEL